ncbi:hypothetical protein CB0940_02969 [Cercospora beticola]|uniref:GDP/GTP exchange factor Sec2 N-terminal domain-containing protein n=1 Tax=Cercospora beticola TaxID=122368 RepID=A0A2G5I597_CERBT|nr:hypothetical protein CB0940_02969 [Cercospora beticola]PIA99979.1 hypothetical protein CB0940_02969 [Cercospora beticola]WPB00130.1 hypothetical protein RHO25_004749 [Cercospora beticola]CAK1361686.1 unnamed protein product [Cercospora beticola]
MASNASSPAVPKSVQSVTRRHGAHDSGLDHGDGEHNDYAAAEKRITELSQENALLAEKATAASLRFIDYENELRVLREALRQQQQQNQKQPHQRPTSASSSKSDEQIHSAPAAAPTDRIGLSRFGSFMRKASVPSSNASDTTHEQRNHELEASLIREQTARIAAETKVKEMSAEIEELSASLFQQANDMVAAERKEKARLQERIDSLEQTNQKADGALKQENQKLRNKVEALEQRETERKRRLEKLEKAQQRIDRVRFMLNPR